MTWSVIASPSTFNGTVPPLGELFDSAQTPSLLGCRLAYCALFTSGQLYYVVPKFCLPFPDLLVPRNFVHTPARISLPSEIFAIHKVVFIL